MDINYQLQQAVEHHKAGNLSEAEALYRQILAINPNHADALYLIGSLALQCEKNDLAIEFLSKAIRVNRSIPTYHTNLGLAYSRLGQISKAIACHKKALALKPDFAEAHHNLGLSLSKSGKTKDAITCYRRALALKPHIAAIHIDLGNAYKTQGQLADAEICLRRGVEIDPSSTMALLTLGDIYLIQQRYAEAEACLRQALQLDPTLIVAHHNLGGLLQSQGHLAEAASCFKQALILQPQLVESKISLIETIYSLSSGDPIAARAFAEQSLALMPNDPLLLRGLSGIVGKTYLEVDGPKYARALFDQFAPEFEATLEKLSYDIPKHMAELLGLADFGRMDLEVLDAGCGTGICARYLRPVACNLTGVDISPNMLQIAKEKKLYDRLHEGELIEHLKNNPASYDMIFSSDVVTYIGNIDDLLVFAARALRSEGVLAFSAEHLLQSTTDASFAQHPSGRYQHSRQYLEQSLAKAGLSIEIITKSTMRMENGIALEALIVIAKKPPSATQ